MLFKKSTWIFTAYKKVNFLQQKSHRALLKLLVLDQNAAGSSEILEEKHVSFPVIWNSLTLQLAKAYYYYY
jgi:hypothetical protein